MSALERGDHVEWNTSRGWTRGTVLGKGASTARVKGWTARASRADPEIVVRSGKSGATAVHHPDAPRKVR